MCSCYEQFTSDVSASDSFEYLLESNMLVLASDCVLSYVGVPSIKIQERDYAKYSMACHRTHAGTYPVFRNVSRQC